MNASLTAHAQAVRERIRRRDCPPAAFRAELLSVPPEDRDEWTHALLGMGEPPPDADLPRGGVPYLPSSVAAILRVVDEVPLRSSDRFVDLGSGLGKVLLLAHLLSGAEALGVEVQEQLVERANQLVADLELSHAVCSVQGDASEQCPDGTVFFIYSSFNGQVLQRVLGRLQEQARERRIVLCAVDFDLSSEWLEPRLPASGELIVYDAERALLHASIDRGLDDAAAGRVIDASALIDGLQRKR